MALLIALIIVWSFWEFLMWRHRVAMRKLQNTHYPKAKKIKLPKKIEESLDDFERRIS